MSSVCVYVCMRILCVSGFIFVESTNLYAKQIICIENNNFEAKIKQASSLFVFKTLWVQGPGPPWTKPIWVQLRPGQGFTDAVLLSMIISKGRMNRLNQGRPEPWRPVIT